MSPTAHAVVPATGLCALNRRQRRPHSRAALSSTHGGIPTQRAAGLSQQWRDPDMYYPFHAPPWKTHRRVPTGRMSSPALKASPTGRGAFQPCMQWSPPQGCAFNHSPSGSHSQAVSPQAHREGSHHGPHTINHARMGPQGCSALNCTPRVPPPMWAVCPQPSWSGPHHKAVSASMPMKGPFMGRVLR